MTRQEAHALVVALRAAFAVPAWDQATVDLYVSKVETLKDRDMAREAISHLIDTEEFRPTIAKVLSEYMTVSRRVREERSTTHGLNLPELTEAEMAENRKRVRELIEKVGLGEP